MPPLLQLAARPPAASLPAQQSIRTSKDNQTQPMHPLLQLAARPPHPVAWLPYKVAIYELKNSDFKTQPMPPCQQHADATHPIAW